MQNWLGTYTIDSTCNTTVCCCLTGQMFFVNYSTEVLGILFNTTGECDKNIPSSINTTYPSSYTSIFIIEETTIQLTLSNNSQTISFVDNTNPACNSNAVKKNDSIQQQMNIITSFFLIFISLIMNIFFI